MSNDSNNKVQTYYTHPAIANLVKEYKPLEKKDIVFSLLFLLSGFLIVDFALFHGFKLGFTISYLIFFMVTTVYIYRKAEKISVFSWLCGALSVTGSLAFFLVSNGLILSFMFILMGILFSIYCMGISRGPGKNSGSFRLLIDAFLSVVVQPFSNIGEIVGSAKASAQSYKKSFGAVIGILVAIPVLCVIIPLLVQSDAAFEGLVSSVISNIGKYLLEIALAVVLLVYIYPFAFGHRHSVTEIGKVNKIKKCFPASPCISFLSAISVVYVVYLLSQLAYFFSAFEGILPADYEHTASAFARRGFYEMFAICVINIAMVSIVSMLAKKKSLAIKLLSTFISLFSVLLIIVAMEKMKLNISIFGLSANRVLVSVFMLMVLFVTLFFIVHIFAPKVSYIKPIIIFCSVLFIAVSLADIDAQVARYNVNAYNTNAIDTLDIEHLGNLSDSAVPELVKLCSTEDAKLSSSAKRIIMKKVYYDYSEQFTINRGLKTISLRNDNDFRSFNIAKKNAYKAISDYYNSLDDKEKEYMFSYYLYEADGNYDEDMDAYYLDNNIFIYDDETGAYTKQTTEEELSELREVI